MRPLSLKGHDRPLNRVRLNREGDILFTCSKDKSICVWYVDNGERIGTYEGHSGALWDVDVAWDSKVLVSAAADGSVRVWDVQTGNCHTVIGLETNARSINFSYSGNLIAFTTTKIGTKMATLKVMDIRENPADAAFAMNETLSVECQSCIFTHLDDTIVIGGEDGRLFQYDIRAPGDAVDFSKPHNFKVTDLQLSRDQSFIISSSFDKTAQLHNARNLETLKTYKSNRPVNSAAISPTRDHIVLGGGEEAINVTHTAASSGNFESKLYHMVHEEEFARFKGHFGPINSLAFNPAGNIVVSGSEDGYVRIQELDKEYLDYTFES